MITQAILEKCLPFICTESRPVISPPAVMTTRRHRLAITISRQTGSGAHSVGEKLTEYLQARDRNASPQWRVFDRNLVETVLDEHNLPRRFARYMPEDRVSEATDVVDELLGGHPSAWSLVQQTGETLLHLAKQGNVILIGRGANIITRNLDHMFHVRLVGSLERRIRHIQQTHGLGESAALEFIRREDRGRKRYLRKYFGEDPDDLSLYQLVINTDFVTYQEAARIISDAAINSSR
jgi:cytidylate kinase